MRLIVDIYPNINESETGAKISESISSIAKRAGGYAHVSTDKYNGDTRIEVTRAARLPAVDITGAAAAYLLEAAKARGISVERLIKETVSDG